MTIGERIKQRREELKMSQEELAQKIGYKSRSSINKIELGLYNLKQPKIKAIADALETTPSYIMGWDDEENLNRIHKELDLFEKYGFKPLSIQKLPILGAISCGEPKFAEEHLESYVEVGTDIKADFCLRAKGDSMINARICDGDIVFIRQQDIVENGEIAAVIVNGDSEATLKRFFYYREKALLILKAENPAYPDQTYIDDELEQVKVIGKAVAFQSDVK